MLRPSEFLGRLQNILWGCARTFGLFSTSGERKAVRWEGVEPLETRVRMSVSASTLVGQMLTPGGKFIAETTDTSSKDTVTETFTVVGPVTMPSGQSAIELDDERVSHNGTTSSTINGKLFDGLTSAGYVEYGNTWVSGSSTYPDTYTPPPRGHPSATLHAFATQGSAAAIVQNVLIGRFHHDTGIKSTQTHFGPLPQGALSDRGPQ
jgi:hypothetical protein